MIGTDRYMAPEQLADGRITPGDRRLRVRGGGRRAAARVALARAARDRGALPPRGPRRAVRRRRASSARRSPPWTATARSAWFAGSCPRATPTRPLSAGGGDDRLAGADRRQTRQAPPPHAFRRGARADRGRGNCRRGDRHRPRRLEPAEHREAGTPSSGRPSSVPRSDDPATQARQLSDFLRAQSRPGAANTQQP